MRSSRKKWKQAGLSSLKRHYGIWVLLCLISLLLAGESILPKFSFNVTNGDSASAEIREETDTSVKLNVESTDLGDKLVEIFEDIAGGRIEEAREGINQDIQNRVDSTSDTAVLGHSRGVLSSLVNRINSGSFFLVIGAGLASLFGSDTAGALLLILLTVLLAFAVWFLFTDIYAVIQARMFLEGHSYDRIHLTRLSFVFRSGYWLQVCKTMFLKDLYKTLWNFTVIGGIIKHYSYFLVPYIAAENPSIGAREAIRMSREMMNGHKWECFKLELSFIGWELLNLITLGLLRTLFLLPYQEATYCEYYISMRELGKENQIAGTGKLHDSWLYQHADRETLEKAYPSVLDQKKLEELEKENASMHGFASFLARNFGIVLYNSETSRRFEKNQVLRSKLYYQREAYEEKVYPGYLNEFHGSKKYTPSSNLNAFRSYSIWSVILIFFFMSFVGWCFEVSLHLLSDGEFVNRGVLHGPWLPIYGTGAVVVLILLYRLRENPILEFFMTIVVCGCVEYFTAYFLEKTYNGTKWWDYTGYFLNLHGRICAEGLLTFGIGGMLIVYLIAPKLDDIFRKINYKVLALIALVLLGVYIADNSYSSKHPNTGKGITSYGEEEDTADQLNADRSGGGILPAVLSALQDTAVS